MAVTFTNASGLLHSTQTIAVTALTATTQYIATITAPGGHTRRIEFTTDGSGAATLTFEPQGRGVHTVTVSLRTPAVGASGSNTFTGV